jgi:hypothetical protein
MIKLPSRILSAWRANDGLLYALTALVSLIATYTSLDLWAAKLSVPLTYWGDALAVSGEFKGVIETGWYKFNPALSAPYGMTYSDFPSADNLNLVWAKIIGFFIPNWPVAMNVYYIICFPLAAVAAMWFFRHIGMSRLFALALGVLYGIAPYHFVRGEGQLFLTSYYVIPLAAGLLIDAIRGNRLWGYRDDRRGAVGVLRSYSLRTIAFIALVATDSSYYAVFFLILLAFAGIAGLIIRKSWRAFFAALSVAGVTVIVMLINMAPDIIYRFVNGVDAEGLQRGHADTEIYALKLTQLLLPLSDSRIPLLGRVRALYDATYPLPSEEPSLGIVAAVGLIALMVILVLAAISRRSFSPTRWIDTNEGLLPQLAAFVLVMFLFSTVGGISTIISFLTTSLRGWNRMSIVIALFCLAAVGILLQRFVVYITARYSLSAARGIVLVAAVSAVLLVVGYLDQTPAHPDATYPSTIQSFDNDAAFFARVQKDLPSHAEVLQLPYVPYPETLSVTGVYGSDQLIPYLHTAGVSWSGGGIKGRPRSDWPGLMLQYSPEQIARLAATSGFSGILVDRKGLGDKGKALEVGLTKFLNETPIVGGSSIGSEARYSYFPLRSTRQSIDASVPSATRARVTTDVTNPVMPYLGPDFRESYTPAGHLIGANAGLAKPTFQIANDLHASRRVIVSIHVTLTDAIGRDSKATGTVTLMDSSGHSATATVSKGVAGLTLTTTTASGLTTMTLSAISPETDTIQLSGISVETSTVKDFLAKSEKGQ